MLRNLKFIVAAVVGIAGVAVDADQAQAFGHHRWGSSGGSWGSSGGSWGSSGGSWGSSGGSWGHHRRWGSSGGSWGSSGGSWGSSGGSSGGYVTYYGSSGGSSGGSWGSSGGSYGGGTVIIDEAPATPAAPTEAKPGTDAPPAPMPGSVMRRLGGNDLAMINVNVPAEAKIFVNGTATTSTGAARQFVSRGLSAGNRYTYEVRAEMDRNGETVTETKTVTLGMGEQAQLAFDFTNTETPVAKGDKSKTKLTLRVPADAKVYLSGRETSSTGELREFSTSKLAPGAEWNDYTVKVVANVDGREVTKEETITLIGGQDRELNIDFGSTELAQAAAVTR
jgi:uncharacterized protein (TIGR03000 family)